MEVAFTEPLYLWLFVFVPILISLHFTGLKKGKKKALNFANFEAVSKVLGTKLVSKNILFLILRASILSILILSSAGTTIYYTGQTNDVNVVLALDVSGSMLADDYPPTRLEAEKETTKNIINNLKGNSKVGLVSFSGLSFLNKQPTEDLDKVKNEIEKLRIKRGPGTAIGNAIVSSVNALEGSEKSKMVILMTDGQSNSGYPIDGAINFSKENNVVVNTIGIGTQSGGSIESGETILKVDEDMLKEISNKTNGNYKQLNPEEVNSFEAGLEETKKRIPIKLSTPFILLSIILLVVDLGLQNTKFKIIPS